MPESGVVHSATPDNDSQGTLVKDTDHGRITAGREKFDSEALTAAHRSFPMGTKVRVTNLSNEKSVGIRVNDRGPFVKGGSLSVTRRAARELTKVRIEQVQ